MTQSESFDIEEMSRKIEVPVFILKERLGIPLSGTCTAITLKEAERAFAAAPEGSEESQIALKKRIELASTADEMEEVCEDVLEGSEAAALAVKKWVTLVQTIEEAENAYLGIADDSKHRKVFLGIWLDMVKTPEEAANVLAAVSADDELVTVERSLHLLTMEVIEDAYSSLTDESKAKSLVGCRWIELVETPIEMKSLIDIFPVGSEEEAAALKRWDILVKEKISFLKTTEEAQAAFQSAPSNSEGERAILVRWIELSAGDMEALKAVADNVPMDSEEATILIKEMAKLFGFINTK
jgi:hypothetical protein